MPVTALIYEHYRPLIILSIAGPSGLQYTDLQRHILRILTFVAKIHSMFYNVSLMDLHTDIRI